MTHLPCGCPGSNAQQFEPAAGAEDQTPGKRASQLRQWPVQLHLVSPAAPYFQGADVLLSADCVAHAVGDFHKDFLKGKSLAVACPKLDDGQDSYVQKIKSLFEDAKINTLTVAIMEVPCCGGLVQLARQALEASVRKAPLKVIVVSLRGEILSETWA